MAKLGKYSSGTKGTVPASVHSKRSGGASQGGRSVPKGKTRSPKMGRPQYATAVKVRNT